MRGLLDRAQRLLALPVAPNFRTRFGDLLLITWFGVLTSFLVGAFAVSSMLGWDALVYTHAVQALVAGGDPWGVLSRFGQFAGPPPSLLPFVPTAWLPDEAVIITWTATAALSAVYILQRLRLPAWWLLFPPVSVAILAGSSALPVMALIVRGGVLADGAAIAARVYSALPLVLLGRWRGILTAVAIVIVTAPFVGWPMFMRDVSAIAHVIALQTNGGQSAAAIPWLLPIAAVCLLILGRRRAAWLFVPALWPYTQGYYAVIALPVIAEAPLVAVALAINHVPGAVVVGLLAQVLVERLGIWRPSTELPIQAAPHAA